MNETIKSYFKTSFEKKKTITKFIILAIAFVVVLIPSLAFYLWLRNISEGTVIGENGFWYIEIVWNKGLGFSGLYGKTAAIFAIQSIIFIVLMAIYWLLVHDKVCCSFVSLAMFGGLFNLIQRACTPDKGVLDYFKFGFWKSFATFNWPDMFVVIGIFGFVIAYIVKLIVQSTKEKKDDKPGTEQTPVSTPEVVGK